LSDVDEDALRSMTRSADKVAHYALDPHYRRGQALIATADALATTFVVLKPDAVAGRRIDAVLDALDDHEFAVVHAATFRFSPLLTREIWRYQFNIASADRCDVVDLLLPSADSLLLVIRDSRRAAQLPAACRLAAAKGPADPALRRPNDLRTLLRSPTTLFNFVHTADEPADVVRELALLDLVTASGIPAAVRDARPMPEDELRAVVDRLYRELPAHDLDADRSRIRLSRSEHHAVARAAGSAGPGWRAIMAAFPGGRVPADALWDVLSIATDEIDSNVTGLSPIIPTIDASHWAQGKSPL
jgi:hypothetical protein